MSDYAEIVEDDADYSNPTNRDYEVDRDRVTLVSVLGEGQFGDVHKGVYVDPVSKQLRHQHVVCVINVSCVSSTCHIRHQRVCVINVSLFMS